MVQLLVELCLALPGERDHLVASKFTTFHVQCLHTRVSCKLLCFLYYLISHVSNAIL